MKIYTASRTAHAGMWKQLRESGFNVTATWIDEAGAGESPDLSDLSRRCVEEAAAADVLILYCERGDYLKGALIEVGAALAHGVPVYCVGHCPSISPTFAAHPLWHDAPDVITAVRLAATRMPDAAVQRTA